MVKGVRTVASTVAQFPKREDGTPSGPAVEVDESVH